MKFATIRTNTGTRAARFERDHVVLLAYPDVRALLDAGEGSLRDAALAGETIALEDVRYAPLVPQPEKIIVLGWNYASHVRERGAPIPEYPALFAKYWRALAGYTILTAGGSVSGTDVIDSFLQTSGSSDRYTAISSEGIPLRATLHNFHATVDWRFLLWSDKLVLRASVGYPQCFAASTTVTGTATRPIQAQIAAKLNSELAADLNPYFTEYVKAPLLGVSAAYRF